MINDIVIYDDIISKENQNLLYQYVKKNDIRWEVLDNIRGEYGGDTLQNKFPAKVHPHWYVSDSDIINLIEEIQSIVSKNLDLSFIENYRYKINWTQPLNFEYDAKHLMHIDRLEQHIAMVYYINDSTGDTHIYTNQDGDGANNNQKNLSNKLNFDKLKLIKKISPKMGRVVIFNGNLNHHADYPIEGDRFIINFNFVAKQKNKSLI